jgi:hypothetical protein
MLERRNARLALADKAVRRKVAQAVAAAYPTAAASLSVALAKHAYIERCRALPSYGATLFPVQVPSGVGAPRDKHVPFTLSVGRWMAAPAPDD